MIQSPNFFDLAATKLSQAAFHVCVCNSLYLFHLFQIPAAITGRRVEMDVGILPLLAASDTFSTA
jgi:hypothetical protein